MYISEKLIWLLPPFKLKERAIHIEDTVYLVSRIFQIMEMLIYRFAPPNSETMFRVMKLPVTGAGQRRPRLRGVDTTSSICFLGPRSSLLPGLRSQTGQRVNIGMRPTHNGGVLSQPWERSSDLHGWRSKPPRYCMVIAMLSPGVKGMPNIF